MLDMVWVRDNLQAVETALLNRGEKFDMARFRRLDEDRRGALTQVESLKAKRNTASGEVARGREVEPRDHGIFFVRQTTVGVPC